MFHPAEVIIGLVLFVLMVLWFIVEVYTRD